MVVERALTVHRSDNPDVRLTVQCDFMYGTACVEINLKSRYLDKADFIVLSTTKGILDISSQIHSISSITIPNQSKYTPTMVEHTWKY